MENPNIQYFEEWMMDNSFMEYVRGNAAAIDKWEKYLASNPHLRADFDQAVRIAQLLQPSSEANTEAIERSLNSVLNRIGTENRTLEKRILARWSSVAASIIVIIGITFFGYYLHTANQGSVSPSVTYNEITVPTGEKAQIQLGDGSRIWINSESKLKYPDNFNKTKREVYLEGEAFFDITHRAEQPFVVNTKTVKVKVLGTAFNIKSYPEEESTETTVVRGLVTVENLQDKGPAVYLKPNESYVLTTSKSKKEESVKDNNTVITRQANVDAIISWKDQTLVFVNEPLAEVAVKLERWYNVKIHILDEDLKRDRYRGKFMKNENVYQVLEAIKITTPIEYRIIKDEIFIDRKKSNH